MLQWLAIENFRNIEQAAFSPGPYFNILHGPNGSGKTSILESIYLLAMGRSFRTHLPGRVIRHDADALTVFAKISGREQLHHAGIRRHRQQGAEIKLNGELLNSTVPLSELLPIQLIEPDSHRLLSDGPSYRRQFLDWGVFYAEPLFLSVWRRLQQALKQRNAALRQQLSAHDIHSWNAALCEAAEQLHQWRAHYIQELVKYVDKIWQQLLPNIPLTLRYYAGWPSDTALDELLIAGLSRDRQLGYTHCGPQRADLRITVEHIPAADALSQGQQKLLLYTLRLAQGQYLQRPCIYLLDDLAAELDEERHHAVLNFLTQLGAQVFITGTHQQLFDTVEAAQFFPVAQGQIQ